MTRVNQTIIHRPVFAQWNFKAHCSYQKFPPFLNVNSLINNKEPNYQNGSYSFEHFLSVVKIDKGLK